MTHAKVTLFLGGIGIVLGLNGCDMDGRSDAPVMANGVPSAQVAVAKESSSVGGHGLPVDERPRGVAQEWRARLRDKLAGRPLQGVLVPGRPVGPTEIERLRILNPRLEQLSRQGDLRKHSKTEGAP